MFCIGGGDGRVDLRDSFARMASMVGRCVVRDEARYCSWAKIERLGSMQFLLR
jgi:hypothetical protein